MNNDNKNPLQFLVTAMTWLVEVMEKLLVGLLDGLRSVTDHASPSAHGLVAVVLPFLTPIPVAYLSARSATQFFSWDPAMAWVLAVSVEGLGIIAWVATAEAYLEHKGNVVWVFAGVAAVYEALLISLNVGLMLRDGADGLYAAVLLMVCLLPGLSAFFYAYNKLASEARIQKVKDEMKAEAERIRQERRDDRRAAKLLKLQGPTAQMAAETDAPFRRPKRKKES